MVIDPRTLEEPAEYNSKYSTISQFIDLPVSSSKKRGSHFKTATAFVVDNEYSRVAYVKPKYDTADGFLLYSRPQNNNNSNNNKNSVCPSPSLSPAYLRFIQYHHITDFLNSLVYYGLPISSLILAILAFAKQSKRFAVAATIPVGVWAVFSQLFPLIRRPNSLRVMSR